MPYLSLASLRPALVEDLACEKEVSCHIRLIFEQVLRNEKLDLALGMLFTSNTEVFDFESYSFGG